MSNAENRMTITASLASSLLVFSFLLLALPVQTWAQNEDEQALQQASEHHTIVITKAETGNYQPRFRPNLVKVVKGIIRQTNEFRKDEHLPELTEDDILQKTAQDFADFMAKTGKYGHNADEQTPNERVTEHGYEVCYIGENIAMQFKSNGFNTGALTKLFFQGWKKSPPHRENMLQTAVTQTGVAIAQSQQTGAYFAVQLVGRPMSQAIEFQVINQTSGDVTYQVNEEQFELPPRYNRRHLLCAPGTLVLISEEKKGDSQSIETDMLYSIQNMDGKTLIEKSKLPDPTKP